MAMNIPIMILLVFSFVFFAIAGFGLFGAPPNSPPRYNFIGLGLMCWVLADLVAKSGMLSK